MTRRTLSQSGLSVVEVLLVLATIALLAAFLLPAMTRTHVHSHRISCTSSLKQIGVAYRLWSNDHEDKYPFASTNAAGSLAFVNSPQVFRHYLVMSNELVMPKILVCSSDDKRTKALDFAALSNSNVSYFVGLDADESQPQTILSGDRNVTGGTLVSGFMRVFTAQSAAGWSTNIHVNAGNVGMGDGSVQQLTSPGLSRLVQAQTLPTTRLAIP